MRSIICHNTFYTFQGQEFLAFLRTDFFPTRGIGQESAEVCQLKKIFFNLLLTFFKKHFPVKI